MKRLLNMAVSQVYFKWNETWYVQKDGLAMGASLTVVLVNLWLKQYKTLLSRDFAEMICPKKFLMEYVPSAIRKSRRDQKV